MGLYDFAGKPIGFWGMQNGRRYVARTGSINLRNADIIEHQTGEGILIRAWQQ